MQLWHENCGLMSLFRLSTKVSLDYFTHYFYRMLSHRNYIHFRTDVSVNHLREYSCRGYFFYAIFIRSRLSYHVKSHYVFQSIIIVDSSAWRNTKRM